MASECREIEALLAPYVDGEAAPQDRASVDAHLRACPPCRDRAAGERAARDVLHTRRAELREHASEQLRARCAVHRPAASLPRRAARPRLGRAIVPLSLAATLLLAVAGAFLFGVGNPVEAIAAQLTVDHLTCFELKPHSAPPEPAAAARRFSETRGWSIGVPPGSASHDLELVGVRRCFSTDGANAHLMYRWHGEPLSVYIVPRTLPGVTSAPRRVEQLGFRAVIWSDGARTYLVMTKRRAADLDTVVGYVRAHVK